MGRGQGVLKREKNWTSRENAVVLHDNNGKRCKVGTHTERVSERTDGEERERSRWGGWKINKREEGQRQRERREEGGNKIGVARGKRERNRY